MQMNGGGRVRPRIVWFLAAIFLIQGALSTEAHALPRSEAVPLFKKLNGALRVPLNWTGSTERCRVGRENKRHLQATLFSINALREFAGLKPVRFKRKYNRLASSAALMMAANFNLDHSPPRSWDCYSKSGALGASASNLAMGASGAEAVLLYADDSGVPSLGHRLHLLNPGMKFMGSGSVFYFNALYVIDGSPGAQHWRTSKNPVVWPAKGYFPAALIPITWSANFSKWQFGRRLPQITIRQGARQVRVIGVRRLARYGQGDSFAWRLRMPLGSARRSRAPFRVAIKSPSGGSTLARYVVRPFRLARR